MYINRLVLKWTVALSVNDGSFISPTLHAFMQSYVVGLPCFWLNLDCNDCESQPYWMSVVLYMLHASTWNSVTLWCFCLATNLELMFDTLVWWLFWLSGSWCCIRASSSRRLRFRHRSRDKGCTAACLWASRHGWCQLGVSRRSSTVSWYGGWQGRPLHLL